MTKEVVGEVERLANGERGLRGELLALAGEHVNVVELVGIGLRGEGEVVEVILILAHVVDVADVVVAEDFLYSDKKRNPLRE